MINIRDERLKPCPFCGEDGIIGYFPADERLNAKEAYYVGCSNDNCGCEIDHAGGFRTLDQAIHVWNTRAKL